MHENHQQQAEEDFPHFYHSTQKVNEKVMILPVIPNPCYEAIEKTERMIEADQSFDISISFNNLEQQDSSIGPEESAEDQSLREFKFIEKSMAMRGSMEDMRAGASRLMTQ